MKRNGRPPLFETVEELQEKIEVYFKKCKNNKNEIIVNGKLIEVSDPKIPTIAGLAYALGISRESVYNYERNDRFFDTIKKARDYILMNIEDKMANVNGNIAGTIFLAKNYGYSDSQKIEHSGSIKAETDEERIDEKISELLELRNNDVK